ncbi:hypothetical protein BC833DRAFT_622958 [Globomyces pollinis-pini]|nr:hypothetical protein BC833DRAFT_622958 [Globomyces pollinis-pini]
MENSVLPPLSIDKSNYTSVQSEHEVNLPPLDTPIDEVLQHHLIRVQETLIDSADAKVSEIKQKLNENQLMLQRTIDEKSRSNVALFRVKKDVNILNKALYGVRKELDQREVDQTTLEQECDASSRYIKDLLKENNGLSDNFKKLQKQFEEAQLKIKQLHDINTNYTSEVKIHKRINAKLKKEMELTVAKSKLAEAALAAEKERNEMLYHSKKGLEGTLLQQQSEVTTSQLAINVLHSENNDLIKIKSATEKQWEEAMTAMSNRDKTIQARF